MKLRVMLMPLRCCRSKQSLYSQWRLLSPAKDSGLRQKER